MSAIETRENILSVSAHLFATRGLAGTTMRVIADGCGIKAASLYHHFASKDEIVAEILARSRSHAADQYAGISAADLTPFERVEALVRATLRSFYAHPEASQIFFENPAYVSEAELLTGIRADARAIGTLWVRALQDAMAVGAVRSDIPAERLWLLLRNMMLSTAREIPTDTSTDPTGEVCSILLRGITPATRGDGHTSGQE